MFERFWPAVVSKPFTTNGTATGDITVADATGIKVGQLVVLTAATLPNLELKVKRVYSGTSFAVGDKDKGIDHRHDISAYTVALSAAVTANFQHRSNIPLQEINRAVYEEEPTVAIRTVQVDKYGNIVGGSGGASTDVNVHDGGGTSITSTTVGPKQALDVNIAGGNITIDNAQLNMELDATDPDGDSVRIYGVDGGGVQRELLVDVNARLQVSPYEVGTPADQSLQTVVAIANTMTDVFDIPIPAGQTLFLTGIQMSISAPGAEGELVYINGGDTIVRHMYFTSVNQNYVESLNRAVPFVGGVGVSLRFRAQSAANRNPSNGTAWAAINGYTR